MPVTPTYPGVYVEEIPSGVRTITGVSTSITAFVGRTLRGPIDKPIRLQSFGDFVRIWWNANLDRGFTGFRFCRDPRMGAVFDRKSPQPAVIFSSYQYPADLFCCRYGGLWRA